MRGDAFGVGGVEHLVKLMLSEEPPRVPACGAGLGAEAGRVGRVAQRQRRLVENLARVQVCEWHLRCGDEEALPSVEWLLELEEVCACESAQKDAVRQTWAEWES